MELVFSLPLLALLVWRLSRYARFGLLSPACALIVTYLVVYYAGSAVYDPDYGGTGARIVVSAEEAYSLAVKVTWLMCAFAAGALLSGWSSARRKRPVETRAFLLPKLSAPQERMALTLGALAILLAILGNGAGDIYSRVQYMTESNHIIKIMGGALLPVAVFVFGATSTSRNVTTRLASGVLIALCLLLTLALSTRLFSLVPALFFAGAFLAGSRNFAIKVALIASVLAAPLLIVIPNTARTLPKQGITALPNLYLELSEIDMPTALHEAANSFFISEAITVDSVRQAADDPIGYVLLGINPAPGFMTNWESAYISINSATPFNTVGDLLRAGTLVAALYFALIGAYFGYLDRATIGFRPNVFTFAAYALSYLFIVTTLQYPLRSATRLIYYILMLDLLFKVGERFTKSIQWRRTIREGRTSQRVLGGKGLDNVLPGR